MEDRPLNRFLDDKIMTKRRDNAPQARMMNERVPMYLQQTTFYSTPSLVTAVGAAPASGIDGSSSSLAKVQSSSQITIDEPGIKVMDYS